MKKIITIIIIIGAVLTLSFLGTWQVQRLNWKKGIIADLEVEYQKDPTQNTYDYETLKELENEEVPILFGSIRGRFLIDKEIFLKPKTYEGKVGAHVIQPFKLIDKGTVLVNRGWIANEDIEAYENRNANLQIITGIFRKPDWNKFTSNNRPDLEIWTKPDIVEIATHFKVQDIVPVMLYASTIKNNESLVMQDDRWYPRNKHLQYAIFWYGMIIVLLILLVTAVKPNKFR